MTIGGSPIIAMATDNLRLFPPLREYEGLLACFQRSNSNNFSVTTCPNTVIRIVVTQTKPEGLLKDYQVTTLKHNK